jgi:hypothetical protein
MKKLFSLMIVCLFSLVLSFGSAFACQNCDQPGEAQAIGSYDVEAWASDYSYDYSYDGRGGVSTGAVGTVMTGGVMDTYAHSVGSWERIFCWRFYVPAFAYQTGLITAGSEVDTWTWIKNKPFKTSAGAGAKFEDGYVFMSGLAIGNEGNFEQINSRVKFGGDLNQYNQIIRYDEGSVISAENTSGLIFRAYMPTQYSSGDGKVVHFNGTTYTPDAITVGRSSVSVDPFGATRSITGHTENMTRVSFSPCYRPETLTSSVYGYGGVQGIIYNGGTYAGGSSSFGYNGYTQGAGEANFRATVSNVGNTATATAMCSSWATANGNPTGNCDVPK